MGLLIRYAVLAFILFIMWRLLKRTLFGLSSQESVTSSNKGKSKTPWEVLGVSRSASPEEIKKAYHEQVQKYHPDKVDGLGEELQKVAEEKLREINLAYESIKTE